MRIHNFKELKVWQKSVELGKLVYEATAKFPSDEKYGLRSQIQRSAVSIASNIAEGSGRIGTKEFQHFLSIANGSAFELETQLIFAKEFNYINEEIFTKITNLLTEIEKMIYSFYLSLNK